MLDRERRLRAAEQREQARLESRVPAHAVRFSRLRQAASWGAEFLQQLWAQDAASRLFQSASCYHSPGLGCAGARGRDSGARNVLQSQVRGSQSSYPAPALCPTP